MKDEINQEELQKILTTGESSEGGFSSNKEPEYTKSEDAPKITNTKVVERLGEYEDELIEKIKKNPSAFTMMTPKGRMTVAEAFKKGYNPQTGQFDLPDIDEEKEKILSKQSPENQEALQRLTDPKGAHVPEGHAGMLGLSGEEEYVDHPGMAEEEEPQMDPAMMQAMMGGGM